MMRPLSGSIWPTAFSPMRVTSSSATRMTPYAVTPATTRTAAATTSSGRSRRRGRASGSAAVDGACEVERGVLREDRVVEPAQLRPGLDADLLHQRRARLAVGLERLGLAPRPVQREHAAAVQPLP